MLFLYAVHERLYEQFITEIQKYWNLREKGLKKQTDRERVLYERCSSGMNGEKRRNIGHVPLD